MPTITITPEHGYVLLAASGSFLVNFWQYMKIGSKRRELKIEAIKSPLILYQLYIEFDNLIHFTVPCSMVWPTPNFQLLPKSPSKHVGKCALFLGHADGWRNQAPGLVIHRRCSLAGRPDHLLYGLLLWWTQRSHSRSYSVHADFGHTFWVHCFVCSWTFGVVVKNLV